MPKVLITEEQYEKLDRLYCKMEKLYKDLQTLRKIRVSLMGGSGFEIDSFPFESLLMAPVDDAYQSLSRLGDFLGECAVKTDEEEKGQ